MFYLKHGENYFPIVYDDTYAICPKCHKFHQVDIQEIISTAKDSFVLEDTDVYCKECSKGRNAKAILKKLKGVIYDT